VTTYQQIQRAAAELDMVIHGCREKFEQSLIDNAAPADMLDELRELADEHWRHWRANRLAEIRAQLLNEHAARRRE
jgi:hypothetical protein